MRYGVPYKGSKNQIAPWVLSVLPSAENFYDVFAGGCAVTHCALTKGKYKHYYVSDIGDAPALFYSAVSGLYASEDKWISREDFCRFKDADPYIRYCWSFGNNGRDYLYSKEVEPWKKALHYAYVYNDLTLFREYGISTDGTRADIIRNEKEYKEKYIKWYCRNVLHSSFDALELQKDLTERIERSSEELRNYLLEGLRKVGKTCADVDKFLGTNGMAGHYFRKSQWEFPTREVYEKLQGFICLPLPYEKVYGLQELLQSLQRLQSLQSLEISRLSYDEIKIKPNSCIYCDPPYYNTDRYGEEAFDHRQFWDWCEKQEEPCFISEYWMPEDRFEVVASVSKRVLLCSGFGKVMEEKIFVPKRQIKRIKGMIERKYTQLMFDF